MLPSPIRSHFRVCTWWQFAALEGLWSGSIAHAADARFSGKQGIGFTSANLLAFALGLATGAIAFLLLWLIRRGSVQLRPTEHELNLAEIVRLNRAASIGRMAAAVSHELSQPLAAILSNAEAAEEYASQVPPNLSEIREALADIIADNRRARAVVENMRAIFKKKALARQDIDLRNVTGAVGKLVAHDAQQRGVQLRFVFSSVPVRVQADEIALEQVLLNLIANGMEAMSDVPPERRVLIVSTGVSGTGSHGVIRVEDNGSGIAEKDRPKIFAPFFTTKSDGLGMGLSICQSIVESLGGRIRYRNRTPRGTLFEMELPLTKRRDLFLIASKAVEKRAEATFAARKAADVSLTRTTNCFDRPWNRSKKPLAREQVATSAAPPEQ